MTVYAHIEHGMVRELVTTSGNINDMYHASWTFVDVTDIPNIAVGWSAKKVHGQWVFNPPAPPSPDMLIRRAMRKQQGIANAGTSVNAGGIFLKTGTDATSLAHIHTLMTMAQFNPRAQFPWTDSSGNVIYLNASQVADLNNQVSAFVQSTYNVLSMVVAAIKGGKIISPSQVDDPPAPVPAWPKNT